MTEHSSSAGCSDLPTREDVQELRQAVESLRDHVQIVWQAIDEVREVIEQVMGRDAAEFWNVEPPDGLPLGRFRPFAGYNPFDEWNEQNTEAVEPSPVPSSNNSADTGDSFENVAPTSAPTHPQNGHDRGEWSAIAPATQQRSLFGAVADSEPVTAAVPANGVAEDAQTLTSQKEAEPNTPGGAYALDDWIVFRHRFSDGQVDAAGIHAEFRKLKAAKQHFVEQLVKTKSADQLRLMALQYGHLDARRNTKPQNAESVYRSCLTAFTLGESVCYQPMQETYEEAVERIVMAMTDETIAAERKKSREEREAKEKALTNPETYAELSRFVSRKGTDQLSDEQLATWDRLNADISRNARKQKQKDTVEQFQSAEIEGGTFRIIEGFHDREQVPLWIVQLENRVERDVQ